MKYEKEAAGIVTAVGGAENIRSVYNCVTRLRFDLVDDAKVDKAALAAVGPVMGTNVAGEQFQVIVGNDVSKVMAAIASAHPQLGEAIGGADVGAAKPKGLKAVGQGLLDFISSVFAPILPAIAGAGVLKGILALVTSLGWMSTETDTYAILAIIADGVFVFLPMLIAVTAARKFGSNPFIALGIAAALQHPNLVALFGAGEPVDFIGIPVTSVSYASAVIPILLAVWGASWIERGLNRVVHASIRTLVVPLVVFVLMVPVTLIALGPAGTFVGNGISGGINWALDNGGVIAGVVIGGLLPLIIMTGMHYALVPFILTNLATVGADKFLPLTYFSNFAQAGSVLGVAIRTKSKVTRTLALSTSFTALMGVTEPAMYGINIPLRRPFIAAMIGSAVGGGISVGFGVEAVALAANGGIPGLPALIGPTFLVAIIASAASFVVAVVMTLVLGFDDTLLGGAPVAAKPVRSDADAQPGTALAAPLTGTVVPLAEVPDATFAGGVIGQGVAIRPTEGLLASPFDGEVVSVFGTKHAIGVRSDDGVEVLLHIGIDTVQLNGEHFTAHVAQGDRVAAGQSLVSFDVAAILAAGYDLVTPIVVTNGVEFPTLTVVADGEVEAGAPLLRVRAAEVSA